ncbi:MAG: hypothetical protein AB7G25_17350 [Sphingomonadaceae bacterium]
MRDEIEVGETPQETAGVSRRGLVYGAGGLAAALVGQQVVAGPKAEVRGRFEEKVALITGGARGQGRAEAEAPAREGADIVLIDSLADVPGLTYSLATQADMDATAALSEATVGGC